MTDKGVDHTPSETAFFAALRRALANKEFGSGKFGPDDLAVVFLPAHYRFFLRFERIRRNTKDRLESFLPGLHAYMIARTAYFDRLFVNALKEQVPQIVLLGAGYDTRAYRFANINRSTRIFELDSAPTQNRKLECLKRARISIPERLAFASINFNLESLGDVLEGAGYDHTERTLFLWEGVSYYLDPGSVDATLGFVSRSSHPDSAIAFDFTISLSEGELKHAYGVREFAQTMQEQHADEALTFSLEEGELGAFLEQRGLRVVEHLNNEDIEKTCLVADDGSLIGRITGHFRFVVAAKQAD